MTDCRSRIKLQTILNVPFLCGGIDRIERWTKLRRVNLAVPNSVGINHRNCQFRCTNLLGPSTFVRVSKSPFVHRVESISAAKGRPTRKRVLRL